MSETPENKQKKPGKGASVFTYLAILFAAAFLMLLLAYFIQQRNNEVAMDGLQSSISSSFASIDELNKENRTLREEAEALKEELAALEKELESAHSECSQLEESYHRAQGDYSNERDYTASWEVFWNIELLYQNEHYAECADAIKTLKYSTFYDTPEAARSRADEIWNALMGMGLLTEEDASANTF